VRYVAYAQIILTVLFILYLMTRNFRSWWSFLLFFTLVYPLKWSFFVGGISFSMAPLLASTAIYFIAVVVLLYLVVNHSNISRASLLILTSFIVISIVKYVTTGQGFTNWIRGSDFCILAICSIATVIPRSIPPKTLRYVFTLLGIFTLDNLIGVLIN